MIKIINKISIFILSLIISVAITIVLINIIANFNLTHILFSFTFLLSLISSLLALLIYKCIMKSDNFYEHILITTNMILFNMLFIYIGPLTVNRSLSTFVYFYAVENKKVPQNIYNESFFKDFAARRIKDGHNFGFLECKNDEYCYPNLKTKVFYNILYPIGKITQSETKYIEFKNSLEQNDLSK